MTMRKATVVSLCPYDLNEMKPGIYPGSFFIPAAKPPDFEVCVITDAVGHTYIDQDRGSFSRPYSCDEIAKSIVRDHIVACICVDRESETWPGLFWLEEEHSKEDIKKNHADKLKSAMNSQNRWLLALVMMADDDWGKTHSHRAISDLQRRAAGILEHQVGKKEWAVEIKDIADFKLCPFCRTQIPQEALVCATCRMDLRTPEQQKVALPFAGK